METKHTPGKWIQSHREDKSIGMYSTQVYTEDGNTIATLHWYSKPPEREIVDGEYKIITRTYREANAKLIAAAPELLEALTEILKWSAHFPQAMNDELIQAKEVIKKITE